MNPQQFFSRLRNKIRSIRHDRTITRALAPLLRRSEMIPVRCALCGREEVSPHKRKWGMTIVKCKNDGMIFTSPRPSDLRPFYEFDYYHSALPGFYKNYEESARASADEWIRRLECLEKASARGKLLDVGCATGEFLKLARERGWKVCGTEISGWAIEKLREGGLTVFAGGLPNGKIETASMDAVTLWDTVEHLDNPRAQLEDAFRILRPGGVLMLSTGCLPHGDPSGKSYWYFPPWHLFYFSEKTMLELLRDTGFRGIEIEIINPASPKILMQVKAQKPGGKDLG
jgi:SAM-dependent methyltransferase